jgi:hypothetical protein
MMNRVLDFIEDHKYGIIVALIIHVILFIYLQVKTYEEVISYDPWSFKGKNIEAPDNLELTEENIQTVEEFELFDMMHPEDVTSHVRSADDSREESDRPNEYYTSYQGNAHENVRDFESQVIQQLQEGRKQKQGDSGAEKTDIKTGEGGDIKDPDPSSGEEGSKTTITGKTMVTWKLDNRKPHNNNDWHVRNPGYTCGDVNGTVAVSIKVGNSGDVTNAKYVPELSQNANYCMIRQAEKYAMMSRFNFDPNAQKSQEGIITYLFVFRK